MNSETINVPLELKIGDRYNSAREFDKILGKYSTKYRLRIIS